MNKSEKLTVRHRMELKFRQGKQSRYDILSELKQLELNLMHSGKFFKKVGI